jgi:hypothetical protein
VLVHGAAVGVIQNSAVAVVLSQHNDRKGHHAVHRYSTSTCRRVHYCTEYTYYTLERSLRFLVLVLAGIPQLLVPLHLPYTYVLFFLLILYDIYSCYRIMGWKKWGRTGSLPYWKMEMAYCTLAS